MKTKKSIKFIGLGIGIILSVFLTMKMGWFSSIQNSIQNKFYDFDQASSEIVIVSIDEKSLSKQNLGPLTSWPRENYAKAIENLNKEGVAAIGIDITFPDESKVGPEDDKLLAESLENHGNVVLASRYYFENGEKIFEWPNNFIEEKSPKLGLININLDQDGFVRMLPVFDESEKGIVEAFSIAISRIYESAEKNDYRLSNNEFNYSNTKQIPIISKFDEKNKESVPLMHINYFAAPNQYTHISFSDVIDEKYIDKKGQKVRLKDKIVIIGPTAIDLQDDYLSPVSQGVRMPGVEIHANNIQTIISDSFLKNQSLRSLWLVIIAIVTLNIILLNLIRVRFAIFILLLEIIGSLVGGIIAYEYNVLLNVVYPILGGILSFVGTYLMRFIIEQKERKFIEKAFGHYVNKTVVKQIRENPDRLKLGGEKRNLTVMFSDIEGFTSISEKLTPEALVKFLNEYLGAMTEIVLKNEGTLDKYEGDAIMCFWNAPIKQEKHALNACLTALQQQKKLQELRTKWKNENMPDMHVRIGIHTGEAVVGNMGSSKRFDYTAMGDDVNLASRLEGINKQYGTFILISEETYKEIEKDISCRELDTIKVKGKDEPVTIYEPICKKDELNIEKNEKILAYEKALELYREEKFEEAKSAFEKITDDEPSRKMEARCEAYIKTPPKENWNGIYKFETK